jgi:hypothetical protein
MPILRAPDPSDDPRVNLFAHRFRRWLITNAHERGLYSEPRFETFHFADEFANEQALRLRRDIAELRSDISRYRSLYIQHHTRVPTYVLQQVLPDVFRNLFRRSNVDVARRVMQRMTSVTREQILQYISNQLANVEGELRRTRAYFTELTKFNTDDEYRTRIILWLQNYGGEDRFSFD